MARSLVSKFHHRVSFYSLRQLLAPAALALGLAACGGDDGDNRLISSLSPTEVDGVCQQWFDELSDAEIEDAAKVACVALASQFGQCTDAAIAECIPEMKAEIRSPEASCESSLDVANCQVTVQQLFDCQNAMFGSIAALADETSCASPAPFPDDTQDLPEVCKVVQEKCPSAIEDDEE
jgi:hypothetical protein